MDPHHERRKKPRTKRRDSQLRLLLASAAPVRIRACRVCVWGGAGHLSFSPHDSEPRIARDPTGRRTTSGAIRATDNNAKNDAMGASPGTLAGGRSRSARRRGRDHSHISRARSAVRPGSGLPAGDKPWKVVDMFPRLASVCELRCLWPRQRRGAMVQGVARRGRCSLSLWRSFLLVSFARFFVFFPSCTNWMCQETSELHTARPLAGLCKFQSSRSPTRHLPHAAIPLPRAMQRGPSGKSPWAASPKRMELQIEI
jgi:hypothetical protein